MNLHPGWRNKRQGHPSERKRCVGLSSSVVSLSPGSQLNTRLCSTIQAARRRLGGSGLQTMSSIREQSFSTSATSNAARRTEKQTSHSRGTGTFAHECGHFPGQIERSSVNSDGPRGCGCRLPDAQAEGRSAFSLLDFSRAQRWAAHTERPHTETFSCLPDGTHWFALRRENCCDVRVKG